MREAQVSTTMDTYGNALMCNALMSQKPDGNCNAVKMVIQPKLDFVGVEPAPMVA